jgi:quercetin dioxygenase-like cupin family protein
MVEGFSTERIDFETSERFVSLRRALEVEAVGINQLTLKPGQRGRIHRHERQEEIYLVIAGTLTIVVEGKPHALAAGTVARVAPPLRRQLVNNGAERCVVVAVGAADGYVGRDGEAFTSWDETQGRPPQEVPLPDDLPG